MQQESKRYLFPSRKIYFFLYSRVSMHMRLFPHATFSDVQEQNTRISTLNPYLIVWIKYMFMKPFIFCSIINIFQLICLERFIFFLNYVNNL